MSGKLANRVLKNAAALATGQGIHLLTQLTLPAAFIHAYGAQGYGEWLVLSAAIGFLTTLDFGLQTFLLNELTVLYHRNEMETLHRLQSTGLRMLLAIIAAASLMILIVFFLPLKSLLNLNISEFDAALTLFLLMFQIIINLALSYINGAFRIFNKAHLGAMWGNIQKASIVISTLALVFLKAPFWAIALVQLVVLVLTALGPVVNLKKNAPDIFPSLKYWDSSLAGNAFFSSMFFGLFTLNNFFIYQAPILILNYFLGPEAVVTFTIGRTLFSFTRQGLTLIQSSIAPEITRLSGIGDQQRLHRLYRYSESAVLSGALVLNAGVYLLSPLLLWLWLKRPELFNQENYLLLMTISAMMSVKEYKLYFQYASNQHIKTSVMMFLTYLFMVLANVLTIEQFGVNGLLAAWLFTELLQIGFIHRYNNQLFAKTNELSLKPVFKLVFILSIIILTANYLPLSSINTLSLIGITTQLSIILMLLGLAYFLFDVGKLIAELKLSGNRTL